VLRGAPFARGFPRETLTKAEFLFADVPELVTRISEIDDYFAAE
jgi:hypothetical protein